MDASEAVVLAVPAMRLQTLMNIVVAISLLALAPAVGLADEWNDLQSEHAWGSFTPGSWKIVRRTTTKFDAQNRPTTRVLVTTETVLQEVTNDGCWLEVSVTTLNNGITYRATPQRVFLPFRKGSRKRAQKRDVRLSIGQRSLSADMYRLSGKVDDKKRETTVFYRPDEMPHLLRKKIVLTSENSDQTVSSDARVTGFTLVPVLDDDRPGWEVSATRTTQSNTVSTTELHSGEVPGTLVSANTVVQDRSGRVVERATVEVVEFGTCFTPRRRARTRSGRRAARRSR